MAELPGSHHQPGRRLYGSSHGGRTRRSATAERDVLYPELKVLGAIGLGAGIVRAYNAAIIDPVITSPYKGFLMMYLRTAQQLYGSGNTAVKHLLAHYLTTYGAALLPNADGCNTSVLSYFQPISGGALFNLVRPAMPPDANAIRQEATVGSDRVAGADRADERPLGPDHPADGHRQLACVGLYAERSQCADREAVVPHGALPHAGHRHSQLDRRPVLREPGRGVLPVAHRAPQDSFPIAVDEHRNRSTREEL